MIRLHDAGVRFRDKWIFRQLDLDISRGTSLAILGPNGRGKTTLIRTLIGAQVLSEGKREAPALVGYVPQTAALAPYSVVDMVVMARTRKLGVFGAPAREDYRRAHDALETVGLAALAARSFSLLSGGERQLVLLARALATGAPAIVLDEPASALDLANQHRLLIILNGLRRKGDHTIVFSTHLPQHALLSSDETLLLLPDGRMLRGATSEILSEANLERTYQVPIRRLQVAGRMDAIVPMLDTAAAPLLHQRNNPHG